MHPRNLFTVNILVSEKEKSDDLFNLIGISCFLLVFCCFVHLPLVPLQVTGLFARVAAPVTFEGFLSSVLALVSFQVTCVNARIITLVTLIWLFSSVLALVCLQRTRPS